jgi:hypothetical protein
MFANKLREMKNKKSPHILNTSSNLLGFCLVVLTSLKISKYNEKTLIDEITGIIAIFLTTSSVLSFLAIRSKNEQFSERYETIADFVFLSSLILISIVTCMIAFTIWF